MRDRPPSGVALAGVTSPTAGTATSPADAGPRAQQQQRMTTCLLRTHGNDNLGHASAVGGNDAGRRQRQAPMR